MHSLDPPEIKDKLLSHPIQEGIESGTVFRGREQEAQALLDSRESDSSQCGCQILLVLKVVG